MREIAVLPTRAGIQNKGLWKLGQQTLVERALDMLEHLNLDVVVTSDQPEVKEICEYYPKAYFHQRPPELADGKHMVEAVLEAVSEGEDDVLIHLIQCTSPFLADTDIFAATQTVRAFNANSFQTIIRVPHNYHEWNQRLREPNGCVSFVNSERRAVAKTKQDKPLRYAFGNLVSVCRSALQTYNNFFVAPSIGYLIPQWRGFDIDQPEDLKMANAIMREYQ